MRVHRGSVTGPRDAGSITGTFERESSGQPGGRNEPTNDKRVQVADEAVWLGSGR